MNRIRQLHLYLGLLFAPSIIFFALSGALQTFSLHESHKGSAYHPPAWIVTLASIHKDQRLARSHSPSFPLKLFILFMSAGLVITTLLGIYMSFKYNRSRFVIWSFLLLGAVLPLSLLFL